MDSYNPGNFSGLLDIHVHHARNIHNICIYANQDVYAKFSLTCSPDDAVSTRVVAGGGKNPQFDEHLSVKIPQPESVLKCEIWMLSRVKHLLEDQLLGFALVPLSLVAAAKGRLMQEFTLSSTDLCHSPAGTVQMTLSLDTSTLPLDSSNTGSSISSEVVLLDPVDYGRIELPDINVVKENQQMVLEYFDMASNSSVRPSAAHFLYLGASSHQSTEDYDMIMDNSREDDNNDGGSGSPDDSMHNSGPFTASTTTSLTDDRTSIDSMDKKIVVDSISSTAEFISQSNQTSPDTSTSNRTPAVGEVKETQGGVKKKDMGGNVDSTSVFNSPLGNINVEAEQIAMQQQIVDMYMKSMQQFTESLANMKLPMNLDKPRSEDGGDVIQGQVNNNLDVEKKKKDCSKVFYGSRAFF
ncbi:uncharacterized protein [Typha angustifolia]|uniref:uncharacterized protein n=1 Tax=Typha angustifolia TaxID=59011 RepID=UPI003C30B492